MQFFRKSKASHPIPTGFTADSIRTESSTCTGETVIGFYDTETRKLCYAELVRNRSDIEAFYRKYGLETPKGR